MVTIRSIFSGGGTSLLGGGGRRRRDPGFVISDGGEIATNAHVVTDAEGGGGPIHEAKEVYVQFADRNQVPAEIVGFDPDADVALLKVDPDGLDLHPLQLATNEDVRSASRSRRSAARSARTGRCRWASSRPPTARSSR